MLFFCFLMHEFMWKDSILKWHICFWRTSAENSGWNKLKFELEIVKKTKSCFLFARASEAVWFSFCYSNSKLSERCIHSLLSKSWQSRSGVRKLFNIGMNDGSFVNGWFRDGFEITNASVLKATRPVWESWYCTVAENRNPLKWQYGFCVYRFDSTITTHSRIYITG